MDKQNLKDLLKQLHEGLQDADSVDVELRSLLEALDKDIVQVLSRDDTAGDPIFTALSERSQALSAQFAARHPKLEPVLRELGGMLEKIGV
ncbi:DUF4404 family protein [Undibacterium sp. Jales W-56]|uniref:DUF4404 family protein n=1 Tax=Undibacterium sp. Jales W-56 TaxID=2897325 RepID=UPI0021CE39AF|nr:DUF4404 family protein [Undibacterium sp. Jales W-56]MCU6433663.1 DUF4404 family protein [Undibacterium sp. Jales W-56]